MKLIRMQTLCPQINNEFYHISTLTRSNSKLHTHWLQHGPDKKCSPGTSQAWCSLVTFCEQSSYLVPIQINNTQTEPLVRSLQRPLDAHFFLGWQPGHWSMDATIVYKLVTIISEEPGLTCRIKGSKYWWTVKRLYKQVNAFNLRLTNSWPTTYWTHCHVDNPTSVAEDVSNTSIGTTKFESIVRLPSQSVPGPIIYINVKPCIDIATPFFRQPW